MKSNLENNKKGFEDKVKREVENVKIEKKDQKDFLMMQKQ
jgi:hypothetical protein